jgi:hypothetical protein
MTVISKNQIQNLWILCIITKNVSVNKTRNKSVDNVATTVLEIMRRNLTWAVGIPGKIRIQVWRVIVASSFLGGGGGQENILTEENGNSQITHRRPLRPSLHLQCE